MQNICFVCCLWFIFVSLIIKSKDMKTKTDNKDSLYGAEYLRCLVNWLNCRDEYKNENKTPLQLMNEYNKYRKLINL